MMGESIESLIGYLLVMGFEGTTVTPQVKTLIEEYHVAAICLQARNLKNAGQTIDLISSLQKLAYDAGYTEPLLISLDQENGGLNSVFDADYIHQFPSAMGLAACNSLELTRSVSSAAAKELSCLGLNWLVGPVFDVHSTDRPQPMGVRCFGEDPEYVAKQALEAMLGYRSSGIIPCAKHFPGFGNLDFLGSPSDIPIISGTFEELLSTFLVPFQTAIDNKLDSIMVAACRMPDVEGAKVPYACLSHAVITGLLRRRMGFDGVIMTECLEIESLFESVGVSQASVMAISAGCDMIEICNSFSNQLEAINGILTAVRSGLISEHQIRTSAERVRQMKLRHLTWDKVWNCGGIAGLTKLQSANDALSKASYDASITLVRDPANFLPLSKDVAPSDKLLLLTPLVEPFGPKRPDTANASSDSHLSRNIAKSSSRLGRSYLEGEATFHEFGVAVAKRWRGKVIHTSYTASGISPLHEKLVSEAAVVVVLTADSVRNMYQYGFTKYIVNLCKNQPQLDHADEKPCVVVAVSSPYDFLKENQVSTYLCTYDLTDPALRSLVKVLFGKLTPTGLPPNAIQLRQQKTSQKRPRSHQLWLVEELRPDRDPPSVQQLLDGIRMAASNTFSDPEAQYPPYYFDTSYYLADYQPLIVSQHFIVRNSSTQAIYGFCATYYIEALSRGCIAAVIVGTEHRGKGIGHSLHQHALHYLQKFANIESVHFGSDIPAIFAGIPNRLSSHQLGLRTWLKNRGWDIGNWNRHEFFKIRSLRKWDLNTPYEEKFLATGSQFESISLANHRDLLEHLLTGLAFGADNSALRHPVVLTELYKRAQADPQGCKVVISRDMLNGKINGSLILYHSQSQLNKYFPTDDQQTGGIAGIVVAKHTQAVSIVQGLVAKTASSLKAMGLSSVQIFVAGDHLFPRVLEEIGFEKVYEFLSIGKKVTIRSTERNFSVERE